MDTRPAEDTAPTSPWRIFVGRGCIWLEGQGTPDSAAVSFAPDSRRAARVSLRTFRPPFTPCRRTGPDLPNRPILYALGFLSQCPRDCIVE